jgi:hypothetical protein
MTTAAIMCFPGKGDEDTGFAGPVDLSPSSDQNRLMTGLAPRSPTNDEALDILRRIEPTLARITADIADVKGEQRRLADIQRKQGEDIARLEGKISQLPTLYQLAGLIFAIFGASFVLIRFASGH